MSHSISAKKRLRQSEKRRVRNKTVQSAVKTQINKTQGAIQSEKQEEARAEFSKTVRMLDKAVTKGVYHKRTAARIKSRLAHKVNGIGKKSAPAEEAPKEPTEQTPSDQ